MSPEETIRSVAEAVERGESLLAWSLQFEHPDTALQCAWSACRDDAIMRVLLDSIGWRGSDWYVIDHDEFRSCSDTCGKDFCEDCANTMRSQEPVMSIARLMKRADRG